MALFAKTNGKPSLVAVEKWVAAIMRPLPPHRPQASDSLATRTPSTEAVYAEKFSNAAQTS
jgi:hypothetical protein